ncbi:MAG: insulinase family protein [Gemmatimonadota bacterium]
MSRHFLAGILALTLAAPALAQTSAQQLPVDPKVTVGTLPNGIRYYIRQNSKPEKRAELRLVVNAGSVQEDDDQLGLAHFLEHTAFNGTTNFKKNELVSYLESIGVRFGADLNAYTSFEETVYILPVPTDSTHIVEKAFLVLEDWAHGQLFDPTEVVNERGVVLEEWRSRKGAGDRMLQQWLPIALKDSRYAIRLPIGTQESIQNASADRLRRFYRDWYRPDLMAVVAVGDFDKAQIESLIKKHFTKIQPVANARPRTLATVPNNVAPLIAIATDKEAASTSVGLTFKMPGEPTRTAADYRRDLVEQIYTSMLNNRLREITQRPDAPFLSASADKSAFIARNTDAFSLDATVKEGGVEKGAEALLTEARRIDQHGFLESELARARENMLRGFERAYTERDKSESDAYAEEYVRAFLYNEPIPGIEYEYQLAKEQIPTVALAEVNALARNWITEENRVVIVTAPDKAGVKVPTQSELLAVFSRSAQLPVTAWTETVSDDPLLDRMPTRGRVVSEKTTPQTGVTEWQLSNGARVLVKPTDFKADEVLFTAFSPGGNSLVSDADFMSASMMGPVMMNSGVGAFSRIDLQKKLAGKVASADISLDETSERMSGGASPKDLETLFQLIHLRFTAPRVDTAVFQAMKNQITPQLANKNLIPEAVFSDTFQIMLTRGHFRGRPMSLETLEEIKPLRALEIAKDRFGDAGDFTFYFVGNVDLATFKPLVETYLASLPTASRKETWKDVGPPSPTGVIDKVVYKGKEPKALTIIGITGPFQYNIENRFALRALVDYFQIKLNETLREQLGGTYSPNVGGRGLRIPRAEYTVQVSYQSSPENTEKLARTVFAMMDSLKTHAPSVADVDKVKEQILRSRETDIKTNAFWMANLAGWDQNNEDLTRLLAPYDAMIRALTPAQIQQAAQRYFDRKNFYKFVLLPETSKPVS